jgi:circadian clock protein KaiB
VSPAASKRPRSAPPTPRGVPADGASERLKRELRRGRKAAQGYVLRLYVTGTTPASSRAIERVRAICEEHLQGRYELDVIDIYQLPTLARDHQIIAAPTLIKILPEPLRRFVGDLSKVEKVLFGLDVRPT